LFIYCNTKDSPIKVGEAICRSNFVNDSKQSWIVNDNGNFCSIEFNSTSHCVAVVYLVSDSVIGIEIDDQCASKVIEPLIEIYGFEKVKWLAAK
jgi:hypothetical protein